MAFGNSSDDDDDRYNYNQDRMGNSQGPTCFDKVKLGAQMGGAIGLCAGLLLGGYAAFVDRRGSRGVVRTVATVMMQSAGSFALFMGVGSALRCEGRLPSPMKRNI